MKQTELELSHDEKKIKSFETRIQNLILKGDKRKASNLLEDYISKGGQLTNKDILKFILEPSGMTVAHKLAHRGDKIIDKEILMLNGEDRSKENSLYGHSGCSVAFIMAKKGHFFTDIEILKLGSETGKSTVAHAMAASGYNFHENEILTLKDDKGTTVAHIMASNGYSFTNKEILNLKNNFGFSVKDFQSNCLKKEANLA